MKAVPGRPAALQKADLAVVLAGAPFLRVPEAARLYHDGLVPAILLTNAKKPAGMDELRHIGIRYPDDQEISLGILDALRVPRSAVRLVSERVDSTDEEMSTVARFLKDHPARVLVLVTSKSHSTRSFKIFRRGLPGEIEVRAHPVPGDPFDPDGWWKNRDSVRQVVQEYAGLAEYSRQRAFGVIGEWLGVPAAGRLRMAKAD